VLDPLGQEAQPTSFCLAGQRFRTLRYEIERLSVGGA
jgi:hypothetical protein